MKEITEAVIQELALMSDAQVGSINAHLTYDTVGIASGPGGNGCREDVLVETLNSIQYVEDQEALYAAIEDELGGTVEINDKPNPKRVKRPNSGGN